MMMRSLTVLVMTASGLILPAANVAAAEPSMCAGREVTIDLNDPAAPDPNRDEADVVLGTPDDGVIQTGAGEDVVCASAGDDVVHGEDGDDEIRGGAGADYVGGGDGADTTYGGPGADRFWLRGDYLADAPEAAYGGAGDDFFTASADDELFAGGTGNDTVTFHIPCRDCGDIYPYPHVGIRVDLRLSGPQNTWGSGIHALSGIENLIGTGFDDVLLGDGERNRLEGFYGDDVINGRRGADDLRGGPDRDRCIGGPGRDRFKACE